MTYCIDTSALLDGWVRHYPPDVFPALWDNLESMIDSGDLISSDEVLNELSQKDDDVYEWAKRNNDMFMPIDEEIQLVTLEILDRFPRLVGQMKDRNKADPFVIAVAKIRDAVVVTGERNFGTIDRPRIPIVCSNFGVNYMDLLQMIRERGWKFR